MNIGDKIGRWSIRSEPFFREDPSGKRTRTYVRCRCSCGTEKDVLIYRLKIGGSLSCGCLQREVARSNAKHGMWKTREYQTYHDMIQRCHNPNNKFYKDYGGRGILVCSRWRESFENFFSDIGSRPDGMSLDRKNNNGGYSPQNCRWATRKQQDNNRRDNISIVIFNVVKTLTEWCTLMELSRPMVTARIEAKWPSVLAIFLPSAKADGGIGCIQMARLRNKWRRLRQYQY